MIRIGYLDYAYNRSRGGNVGGDVIKEVASKMYLIETCDIDGMDRYPVVLVSIPSTRQIADYYIAAKKAGLQARKCKIIVGGAGVQNVSIIADYFDCAFFGRAHDVINEVIKMVLDGEYYGRNMLGSELDGTAEIRQAELYSSATMAEEFTGCNSMCKFCHYTYSREYTGGRNSYVQGTLTGGASLEIMYKDIVTLREKPGRLRVAIDGFSERLRLGYGKKISNDMIISGIDHLGQLCANKMSSDTIDMFGGRKPETTVLMVYNICNFPGETPEDEQELVNAIRSADPAPGRVIVILHSTPFRPSVATPMQWEPANIFPDWSRRSQEVLIDRDNLLFKYSYTLEGPFSHLKSLLIERARYDDIPMIEKAIGPKGYSKGTSAEHAQRFVDSNDVSWYIGEHDIDLPPPTPYVVGRIKTDKLARIAHGMRVRMRSGCDIRPHRDNPLPLMRQSM